MKQIWQIIFIIIFVSNGLIYCICCFIIKLIIYCNKLKLNILVICAHPDDETIGMGGTLKKLSKFHKIKVVFLSEGITARRKSGYVSAPQYDITHEEIQKMEKEVEVRKKHARKALKILGVQKVRFLDLPNQELEQIRLLKII